MAGQKCHSTAPLAHQDRATTFQCGAPSQHCNPSPGRQSANQPKPADTCQAFCRCASRKCQVPNVLVPDGHTTTRGPILHHPSPSHSLSHHGQRQNHPGPYSDRIHYSASIRLFLFPASSSDATIASHSQPVAGIAIHPSLPASSSPASTSRLCCFVHVVPRIGRHLGASRRLDAHHSSPWLRSTMRRPLALSSRYVCSELPRVH